ncbi:hypothetical protein Hamer_G029505 [Homarus americanus]|uniref:Uncharacterized protein n=1 Tax=Homarus americanus TaxID=6706 RepID=A0A8J5N6A6_HOMAM|nr:hypothetical protein Hamer_G029505 [Homarus americanus]
MLETTHKEWQVKEEGRKPTTINWKLAMRMGQDTNFPGIEKKIKFCTVSQGGAVPTISDEGVPSPVENKFRLSPVESKFPRSPLEIKFPQTPVREFPGSPREVVPTVSCGDQVPSFLWRASSVCLMWRASSHCLLWRASSHCLLWRASSHKLR